jgi:hypothetical protein
VNCLGMHTSWTTFRWRVISSCIVLLDSAERAQSLVRSGRLMIFKIKEVYYITPLIYSLIANRSKNEEYNFSNRFVCGIILMKIAK